ncbi:hypothetical protein [Algisphaera agarilytica]|uniref:Uncharacterized protein n=1 Tax=Algisphaera agarilytica TaxID=1385975 RepID=A0A7X0LJT9_9BACT|nr:hypothetical protein [Algisphaera agarilytica]MBB6429197.1 hypothetical protein [Algisphaera agarilytica]
MKRLVDFLLGLSLAVWALNLTFLLMWLGGHRLGVGNFTQAFVLTLIGCTLIVYIATDTLIERYRSHKVERELQAHRRTFDQTLRLAD